VRDGQPATSLDIWIVVSDQARHSREPTVPHGVVHGLHGHLARGDLYRGRQVRKSGSLRHADDAEPARVAARLARA
jgi:hypothetical protein